MSSTIRVGIVGANPNRGWALRTHIPALAALPGFQLTAVSTTRLDSARESAARFGAAHAFDDPRALAASDDVDVVTISVKVPHHYELTKIALDAGKHVYTEWPLGTNTKQARELLELAQARGVQHIIGLQGRKSPTVNYVRHLVANGYVGRVLSVTLSIVSAGRGGTTISPERVWASDHRNGATMLTVSAGHSLDTMRYALGELTEVSAKVDVLDPVATIVGSDEKIDVTSADQVLVIGRLASCALLSGQFLSAPKASGTRWSILGDRGALIITGTGLPHVTDSELTLQGSDNDSPLAELTVPDSYRLVPAEVPEGAATNVAALYLALADAIAAGSQVDPDFATALSLHRLTDAIQASSDTDALVRI